MIAVIDNYDSFTYNLVQFFGEIILHQQVPGSYTDREIRVWRNDEIDVEELADLKPTHIVISPGPGTPGSLPYERAALTAPRTNSDMRAVAGRQAF